MAHHRCTRCKEEAYPRHKYASGLFCERCLAALGVFGFRRGLMRELRGLWSDFWSFVSTPFKPRVKPARRDAAVKVAYSVMKAKARDIPLDAQGVAPQMR